MQCAEELGLNATDVVAMQTSSSSTPNSVEPGPGEETEPGSISGRPDEMGNAVHERVGAASDSSQNVAERSPIVHEAPSSESPDRGTTQEHGQAVLEQLDPDEWERIWDEQTQRHYWFNHTTDQSRWDPPPGLVQASAELEPESQQLELQPQQLDQGPDPVPQSSKKQPNQEQKQPNQEKKQQLEPQRQRQLPAGTQKTNSRQLDSEHQAPMSSNGPDKACVDANMRTGSLKESTASETKTGQIPAQMSLEERINAFLTGAL